MHDGNGSLRGSEGVALSLLDGIDQQRYRWVVLTNHGEFAAACRARGIPTEFRPFRMLFTKGFRLNDLLDLVRFSAIGARVIRRERISLAHLSNGGTCSWMIPASWLCGVPTLVHLHAHWSRKMRLVLGLHFADRIVGVSRSVLAGFHADSVAAGRLQVIYSGLDRLVPAKQDRQTARAEFVGDPGTVVIAVIAALVDAKRVDIAIEAIRLLPSNVLSRIRLLVVGDGSERATLQEQAAGLPITFTGHRTDVHELVQNVIDIVVLPSESEAFGIVLLEAAAAKVPRVGSNIGGIREAIVNGVDGILVPVRNPEALAAAITQLARDPELRKRYGAAAQQRLYAEFTTGRFLAEFTSLYDHMCNTPRQTRAGKCIDVLRSVRNQIASRRKLPRNRDSAPGALDSVATLSSDPVLGHEKASA
ncbi:MAG: glycosyltransferase [Alphaproteobacteria bacterium]|nr:glycosyltransferase [Alphaproteobacteria bacterium]